MSDTKLIHSICWNSYVSAAGLPILDGLPHLFIFAIGYARQAINSVIQSFLTSVSPRTMFLQDLFLVFSIFSMATVLWQTILTFFQLAATDWPWILWTVTGLVACSVFYWFLRNWRLLGGIVDGVLHLRFGWQLPSPLGWSFHLLQDLVLDGEGVSVVSISSSFWV